MSGMETDLSPAQHRSMARRRKVWAERLGSARQTLSDIDHGCEIVVLTHGQFSIIHALEVLLDQTGPADLAITTWSAANADLNYAKRFLDSGAIRSLRMVVDNSFVQRKPEWCAEAIRLFGDDCMRSTRSHAKFVTLRNDDWNLAIRTSMNLNENERLELLEISDDPALADFLDGQVDQIFETVAPGDMLAAIPAATVKSSRFGRVNGAGRVSA